MCIAVRPTERREAQWPIWHRAKLLQLTSSRGCLLDFSGKTIYDFPFLLFYKRKAQPPPPTQQDDGKEILRNRTQFL